MESQLSIEELLYEEEGATLDFKREQYAFSSSNDHQKSEILKDILAFSNAWRRVDAYILIGVEEVKGGRSKPIGILGELDDAQLQQFVNSKAQRPINFTYSTVLVDELKIGVIRIPVQTRPFYLEKDYGKLKRHVVYIRRGSSTDEATPEEVRDMGRSDVKEAQEIPGLSFEFADLETRTRLGTELNIETVLLDIPPKKEIPDFREERETGPFGMYVPSMNQARPDYYRNLVTYYYVSKKSAELAFSLKNDSNKAISDIRVEIIVNKQNGAFTFFRAADFPDFPKSHYDVLANIRPIAEQIAERSNRPIDIQDMGDRFRIEVSFEKVQPKQTAFSYETVFIAANDSFLLDADITIYADNIPIPIERTVSISCNVTKEEGSLERIQELHRQYFLTKYSS